MPKNPARLSLVDRGGDSHYSSRHSRSLNDRANNSNGSSTNGSYSDEQSSDSDYEHNPPTNNIKVGSQHQADIPDTCSPLPAPENYRNNLEILIWKPTNKIPPEAVDEYMQLAVQKYDFVPEQALCVLYWHKYNLQRAYADLPNYKRYPNPEWTPEDKALFEEAYGFHQKLFDKYKPMFPEKMFKHVIEYYYIWKKSKKLERSYIEKRLKKSNTYLREDSPAETAVNHESMNDSDGEFNFSSTHRSTPGANQPKECAGCKSQNAILYYNTKVGVLCPTCYVLKRKDRSVHGIIEDKPMSAVNGHNDEDEESLPPTLTSMLKDENVLCEIAQERSIGAKYALMHALDEELKNLRRSIRSHKQQNASLKNEPDELGPFPLLNAQSTQKFVSRWTDLDVVIFTCALRDFGKDFKTISQLMGNKSEAMLKTYYMQHFDRYKEVPTNYHDESDLERTPEGIMNSPGANTPKSFRAYQGKP